MVAVVHYRTRDNVEIHECPGERRSAWGATNVGIGTSLESVMMSFLANVSQFLSFPQLGH